MKPTVVDRDTQEVMDILNDAMYLSGLSLRAFSHAAGTSKARFGFYRNGSSAPAATFVLKAARLGRALAAARRRGIPSSLDAVALIEARLEAGDEEAAFSSCLQARSWLRDILRSTPEAAEAWEARPRPWDRRFATLFAAIVAHEFKQAGHLPPTWTEPERLDEPWMVPTGKESLSEAQTTSPSWLAACNVFVGTADLECVP